MSRITTSRASLSCAMPAMRRACSSGVSRSSLLIVWFASSSSGVSVAGTPVEPSARYLRLDRRWNQPRQRLAAARAGAQVAGRDRRRVDLEEDDTPLVLGRHRGRIDAAPRRDTELDELEHAVGLLPGREVAVLVRADQEDRVLRALGAQQVDRVAVRVCAHLGARYVGERELRERDADLDRALDGLVRGVAAHEDDEPLEVEPSERAARERE